MGAERRNSDVGRSRVSKSVREGFPKEVIPILCLKWQKVVIQIENPGKAYPGENLLEETAEFDKAGANEVGTRSGRVYYVMLESLHLILKLIENH